MRMLLDKMWPVKDGTGQRALISLPEFGRDACVQAVSFDYGDVLLNSLAVEVVAGLIQITMPPVDEAEWIKTYRSPLAVDQMATRLAPFVPFFESHGPVAAYQDHNPNLSSKVAIGRLFPADADLDVPISLAVALVALAALQAHAPSGGRGHRNSLTGGGPLRTVPAVGGSLFQRCYALVLPATEFRDLGKATNDDALRFPWMRPAVATELVTRATHPAETIFTALPRRVRLGPVTHRGFDPILGFEAEMISEVWDQHGGADHPAEGWNHPFTPYIATDKNGVVTASSIKAKSYEHGIGWQHRLGLVSQRDSSFPAAIVTKAKTRLRAMNERILRLHAYGFRCDNAKVLGVLDAVQPYRLAPSEYEKDVEDAFRLAVEGVRAVQLLLRRNIQIALGQDGENSPPLSGGTMLRISSLWSRTEAAADEFQTALIDAFERDIDVKKVLAAQQEKIIQSAGRAALSLFDEITETYNDTNPVRVSGARVWVNGAARSATVREAVGLQVKQVKERKKGVTK